MKKECKKKDARVWVNKDDIVVYDGTKEAIDKIYSKARKLGGHIDKVRYLPLIKRHSAFHLHLNPTCDENYYEIIADSVVVFTDNRVLCYPNMKAALKDVRVRTGVARATLLIQTDDKIVEYVFPAAIDVSLSVKSPTTPSWVLDEEHPLIRDEEVNIDIRGLLPDKNGNTHWRIDRVQNPDYVVPDFESPS